MNMKTRTLERRTRREEEEEEEEAGGTTVVAASRGTWRHYHFLQLKNHLLKTKNFISILFCLQDDWHTSKRFSKNVFSFFGFRKIDRYWLLC